MFLQQRVGRKGHLCETQSLTDKAIIENINDIKSWNVAGYIKFLILVEQKQNILFNPTG